MQTAIISNTYNEGKRISTQEVTYEKSDDLFTLANLQRQLENLETHIANPNGADVSALTEEKNRIELEISAQETILNGYEEE